MVVAAVGLDPGARYFKSEQKVKSAPPAGEIFIFMFSSAQTDA
jgi:hypothetical protein